MTEVDDGSTYPLTASDDQTLDATNKREIFGWKMYDWAWSAFSTTVGTALLGPYLLELAKDNGGVNLLGWNIEAGSFFPFTVSLSAIMQVLTLPIIGAIADHTDHKKRLMMAMAFAASACTMAMFFIVGSTVILGGVLFILASIGFAAAGVIYNSYLPEIVPTNLRDRVSSAGFAYGYLGGGLWLAANFGLVVAMDDTAMAVRLCLGLTGLWCALFFGFPQRLIQKRPANREKPREIGWLKFSVSSVLATGKEMAKKYPVAFKYLLAYLIFNDGILTVILIAGSFAADELGAESEQLLMLVLLIQFVAIPGALAFGRLAEKFGSKKTLLANLGVWAALVIYAYLQLDSMTKLWFMGVVLSLVLGGSQAISRSLYSQMIPSAKEAEYFGFYEIASRGTSWIGPAAFGVVNQLTGSQRQAILALIVFFVLGIALLIPVNVRKGMLDAGNDPNAIKI